MNDKEKKWKKNEYVTYKNCKVFPKTGKIISAHGNEIGKDKNTVIYYDEDKKKHHIFKQRFVYQAVYGDMGCEIVIRAKDGDDKNASIDNILAYKRKDWFGEMDWKFKAVCDEETCRKILEDKEHGKMSNGRPYSYRALAEKYRVSLSTITKIIQGEYFNEQRKDN